ncbi:MAG: N-acyl-D-amino-acid deacylase family protein [Cyclobacteriaceae bacterium]
MNKILKSTLITIGMTGLLSSCQPDRYDLIIREATIIDGTGTDGVITDIGINADTIAFIGNLSKAEGKEIINAKGLVLAPGFIDTHSHHDWGLQKNPEALAVVSQGITTIITGQDGGSNTPLEKYFQHLADSPVAVNLASYSGHNTIREMVLGKDFKRKASQTELDSMKKILKADLDAGALGLSTGLEYDPGIYSAKEEVLELSKVLPEYKGRYISHLRSEDRYFHDAVDEIIDIGRATGVPVQISHFKLAMRNLWGQADDVLTKLNKAREEGIQVTADLYPYPYWASTIRVLFPSRNFNDVKEAKLILSEVTSAEGILFSNYDPNPEYNGKTLAEVAQIEKQSPENMLIELIRRLDVCEQSHGDCSGSIVATSMDEADIVKLMQWEHTSICSDGSSSGRHPRGFGAFPRVLAKYVREQQNISLPTAIRKMTSLSAEQMGITRRGRIAIGHYADLVLFDPDLVADHSTTSEPQAKATGIIRVWVNGQAVYAMGKETGVLPGKVIKRIQ